MHAAQATSKRNPYVVKFNAFYLVSVSREICCNGSEDIAFVLRDHRLVLCTVLLY